MELELLVLLTHMHILHPTGDINRDLDLSLFRLCVHLLYAYPDLTSSSHVYQT